MHTQTLTPESRRLLAALKKLSGLDLNSWVLAGGTGLALQLGHRVSLDFDFFRTVPAGLDDLHPVLRQLGVYETLRETAGSLTVMAMDTKISFFAVPDPLLYPCRRWRGLRLADIRDIALMKLLAISGRGARKDFIDLYFILRQGGLSLEDYVRLLPDKYGESRCNGYNIIKSLTYFTDAEKEPLPQMLVPFAWKDAKTYIQGEAAAILE